ncbi:MAG TPA: (2Fe-2S) ferredoxin domain-containing protein [Feifaniaceae bacterium]|nr:(2Fe-2S) ferredoxin domain-containing protein [Feifaniaceae bacterium]
MLQTFLQLIEAHALHDSVTLRSAFCMRQCDQPGVRVSVNGRAYGVAPEAAGTFFETAVLPLLPLARAN